MEVFQPAANSWAVCTGCNGSSSAACDNHSRHLGLAETGGKCTNLDTETQNESLRFDILTPSESTSFQGAKVALPRFCNAGSLIVLMPTVNPPSWRKVRLLFGFNLPFVMSQNAPIYFSDGSYCPATHNAAVLAAS